jgi:hypothetical protein
MILSYNIMYRKAEVDYPDVPQLVSIKMILSYNIMYRKAEVDYPDVPQKRPRYICGSKL